MIKLIQKTKIKIWRDKKIDSLGDVNIAIEWYKFAEEKEDVFKFMAYWMAFNFLYVSESSSTFENCKERVLIKKYIKEYYSVDESIYDKIMELEATNILKKYPVLNSNEVIDKNTDYINMHIDNNDRSFTNMAILTYQDLMKSDSKEKKLISLFYTLYKVRCNLFHGGKRLNDERDMELVKAGSNILKLFLHERFKMMGYKL